MAIKRNQSVHSVNCTLLALITFLPMVVLAGQPPVVQQLYDQMVNAYTTASTYQDKVTVMDVLFKLDGKEVMTTTERTGAIAFERATKRFRFEYEEIKPSFFDLANRYIVWSDGEQVKTWWTQYNTEDSRPSLAEALEAATSVSLGLTTDLPGLVLSDSIRIGWSMGPMTNLTYLGTARLNGHACYQISGLDQSGRQLVLWIDQLAHTLLGIDKGKDRLSSAYPGLSTLRFEPILNQPIAERDFALNVPAFYWHWFWPMVGSLLWLVPLVLVMLGLTRLFNRFRRRPVTI